MVFLKYKYILIFFSEGETPEFIFSATDIANFLDYAL